MESDGTAGADTPEDYARDGRGRFAEGNRGGPGRPKGSTGPSLKAALLRAIEESMRDDGRDVLDVLARRIVREAAEGDFRFVKEIWDRLDGPVRQEQTIDQTVVVERVSRRRDAEEDRPDAADDLP